MTEPQEPSDSTSPPRQGHAHDLAGLIESLQRLLHRVGSLLWESRLSDAHGPNPSAEVAIAQRLSSHLERTIKDADSHWSTVPPEEGAEETGEVHRTSRAPLAEGSKAGGSPAPIRRTSSLNLEPRVGEQLQRRTIDYINTSLRMARYGDKAGAKLHAELAENAMRTAVQYLSAEEFQDFKTSVEGRLKEDRKSVV
jgi:hypothetical protein